jgi:hypothetical protein
MLWRWLVVVLTVSACTAQEDDDFDGSAEVDYSGLEQEVDYEEQEDTVIEEPEPEAAAEEPEPETAVQETEPEYTEIAAEEPQEAVAEEAAAAAADEQPETEVAVADPVFEAPELAAGDSEAGVTEAQEGSYEELGIESPVEEAGAAEAVADPAFAADASGLDAADTDVISSDECAVNHSCDTTSTRCMVVSFASGAKQAMCECLDDFAMSPDDADSCLPDMSGAPPPAPAPLAPDDDMINHHDKDDVDLAAAIMADTGGDLDLSGLDVAGVGEDELNEEVAVGNFDITPFSLRQDDTTQRNMSSKIVTAGSFVVGMAAVAVAIALALVVVVRELERGRRQSHITDTSVLEAVQLSIPVIEAM